MNFSLVVCLFCAISLSAVVGERFGYSAAEQRLWRRKHKVLDALILDSSLIFMHFLQHCSGPNQSPIAIHSRRSIPMNIPAVEFVFYHNLLPGSIKIHNNGHSLSLITPKPENFTQFPFVFGGKLRAEYEYVGLHFHWGDKNNRGSVRFISAIVGKLLGTEAFRGPCVGDVYFE